MPGSLQKLDSGLDSWTGLWNDWTESWTDAELHNMYFPLRISDLSLDQRLSPVHSPESIVQSPAFKMTPHAGTCTRSESNNLSCDAHTNLEDIKTLGPCSVNSRPQTNSCIFPALPPIQCIFELMWKKHINIFNDQ